MAGPATPPAHSDPDPGRVGTQPPGRLTRAGHPFPALPSVPTARPPRHPTVPRRAAGAGPVTAPPAVRRPPAPPTGCVDAVTAANARRADPGTGASLFLREGVTPEDADCGRRRGPLPCRAGRLLPARRGGGGDRRGGRWVRRPPVARARVIAVDTLFLLVAVLLIRAAAADPVPPRRGDLAVFATFTGLAVLAAVVAGLVDTPAAVRRDDRQDLVSTWTLPVALLLPPVYALFAHVPLGLWGWAARGRPARGADRPGMPSASSRLDDAAALGLASAAASAVHRLAAPTADPSSAERFAGSSHTFAALVAAVATYLLVSRLLRPAGAADPAGHAGAAGGAPQRRGRDQGGRDQLVIAAVETGTAVIIAVLWTASPLLLVVAGPLVLLLRRGLAHADLLSAARTDPKTRLANVGYWRQVAERELARARRLRRPVSVLLVDVDHFKQVNDRHGHLDGDLVLLAVADALRAATRPQDLVGRFGGEEFVVLLAEVDLDAAAAVAERIRHEVAGGRIRLGRAEISVTVSVGVASTGLVATWPAPAPGRGSTTQDAQAATVRGELSDLLDRADSALYQAKRDGRDRVRTAAPPAGALRRAP